MPKRFVISLVIFVVGMLILSGCLSKSSVLPGEEKVIPQAVAPVEWNFIVYLDGDNNLESYAISDLNEMEQVGSSPNVNVLVLVDLFDTWTGTRLYRIVKDPANSSNIVSTMIRNFGELDMSNPTTLKNFIVDCQALYPSNRTVLTLWNHGDGVYPRGENKGICWDDTTGTDAWDCLTGAEVLTALAQARAITGKKIDILNCDACLMQMMEVAYEWRTEMSFLVGSEEAIPGEGNNYDTVLATLIHNPMQASSTYARALVTDYYNYYRTQNTTSSAIDMGIPFTNLVAAFKAFATAMKNTPDMAAAISARTATVSFTFDEYKDLYSFADNIYKKSTDMNAKSTASALKTDLSQAIINHKETGTFTGKAYGLSILLPTASQRPTYFAANQYPGFLLSIDSDWDEFIRRF